MLTAGTLLANTTLSNLDCRFREPGGIIVNGALLTRDLLFEVGWKGKTFRQPGHGVVEAAQRPLKCAAHPGLATACCLLLGWLQVVVVGWPGVL